MSGGDEEAQIAPLAQAAGHCGSPSPASKRRRTIVAENRQSLVSARTSPGLSAEAEEAGARAEAFARALAVEQEDAGVRALKQLLATLQEPGERDVDLVKRQVRFVREVPGRTATPVT